MVKSYAEILEVYKWARSPKAIDESTVGGINAMLREAHKANVTSIATLAAEYQGNKDIHLAEVVIRERYNQPGDLPNVTGAVLLTPTGLELLVRKHEEIRKGKILVVEEKRFPYVPRSGSLPDGRVPRYEEPEYTPHQLAVLKAIEEILS